MPSAELLDNYLRDSTRRGPEPDGALSGAAGGSACGDLIRISLLAGETGTIESITFEAEGCAALRACAAALAEELEGESLLFAATLGAERVAELVGGLDAHARHAAELVADALGRAISALAGSNRRLADEPNGERILVAFSGGVDSTVAALLERERGAEVIAVTLKLWADEHTDGTQACCSPEAVRGARRLAHEIDIPHLTLDLEDAFRREVVGMFIEGYRNGVTPNPCVRCNGSLRIDAMVELADRLGASELATGHYARIADDGEGPLLSAAADEAKDQTYMLAGLDPATLARLRFPLAGLSKPEVREHASAAGLDVAKKRESQDLCFLAGQGKRSFLERHGGLGDRQGEIVDSGGSVLGTHAGHHRFTVGQRRGLGIGGSETLYVLAIDAESNRVVVGAREELATRRVKLRGATLLRESSRATRVRLRYHSKALGCTVSKASAGEHGELELELDEPAYGVAPGQTACLLDGARVVGSATIV